MVVVVVELLEIADPVVKVLLGKSKVAVVALDVKLMAVDVTVVVADRPLTVIPSCHSKLYPGTCLEELGRIMQAKIHIPGQAVIHRAACRYSLRLLRARGASRLARNPGEKRRLDAQVQLPKRGAVFVDAVAVAVELLEVLAITVKVSLIVHKVAVVALDVRVTSYLSLCC